MRDKSGLFYFMEYLFALKATSASARGPHLQEVLSSMTKTLHHSIILNYTGFTIYHAIFNSVFLYA